MTNLAEQLRAGTASAHAELDSLPGLANLLTPALDMNLYQSTLLRLHRAWAPVEGWLEAALSDSEADRLTQHTLRFYLPRRGALVADLEALGCEPLPPGEEAASLIACLQHPAGRLGCLYVLLGSQMGSMLLERQIVSGLPGAPIGFFRCRFPELGSTWRSFQAFVNNLPLSSEERDQSLMAANLTFQYFISCLR
ncbi:MAG: biliverdin-producing heme oxygenase [Pseudomonadota bacterium]|nr:biliverdin-producing heme oxygenase [Pseudomonadota bacterium]